MKISFIEPHLKIYGGIRRILELGNRLTKRGHDVTIFHSDGSPCEWMPCIAKTKSYKQVLEERHDVLIYNDPNPTDYYLAREAASRLKIFYVLELYEMNLLKDLKPKLLSQNCTRTFFIKASLLSRNMILANASWLVNWLSANLNLRSQLLLGGINTEMFYPARKGKYNGTTTILCSGDPRPRKGTKTIWDAFDIVKREQPRVTLETYYDKGIHQSEMAEKYSSADIFVDGQLQAGWNNPVAEAMACKVPVVCSDIGGVKDFAYHGKTALLVPPADPQAMATAILDLIRDESLRMTLADNAYRNILKFDWDASAKRLEQIALQALNERKSHIDLKQEVSRRALFAARKGYQNWQRVKSRLMGVSLGGT